MEFKKLNAPSLRELFVNELQNMILSGKLEIGSKLPPERELAESMKVSRAVINSGIAELEKKGFLVVRPRIGTFVADYRRDGSLDTLVAIMNYNGGVLKNREVKSVLEARIMFMVEASQFAIDRASDKELLGLQEYVYQPGRGMDTLYHQALERYAIQPQHQFQGRGPRRLEERLQGGGSLLGYDLPQ